MGFMTFIVLNDIVLVILVIRMMRNTLSKGGGSD